MAFAYYHEIPANNINQTELAGLYVFLKDNSDRDIHLSSGRDIDFLDKYLSADPHVIIAASEIILKKKSIRHLWYVCTLNTNLTNFISIQVPLFRNSVRISTFLSKSICVLRKTAALPIYPGNFEHTFGSGQGLYKKIHKMVYQEI